MRRCMGSDENRGLLGILRRLHARGLESGEWFGLLVVGALVCGGNGYNLFQFVMHGRFYVMMVVRGSHQYWAYWHKDAVAIVLHGLLSFGMFLLGAVALATTLIYPLLILRWGRSSPAYLRKPPLNL